MNSDRYFANIKSYKLLAKKEVGQNFLVDPEFAERAADLLLGPEEGPVYEIGCGAGSLTYFLIEKGYSGKAVDIDEGLLAKLHQDFPNEEKLVIERENALEADLTEYTQILGNLPYYITSSLLEKVLLETPKAKRGVFMVQKEAYERVSAKAGTKDYSPLGIVFSMLGKAKKEYVVPPSAFSPAPHVESLVFSYDYDPNRDLAFMKGFYLFLKKAFSLRRKTLHNCLKKDYDEALLTSVLAKHGALNARAEGLKPEALLAIYEEFSQAKA